MISLPTLDGKPLLCFPCSLEKKPITEHGYKNATTDVSEFMRLGHLKQNSNFLYGVPTGAANGFDVLDIDPKGFAWAAEQKLPTTRVHRTPRLGFHYLFNHATDLRNSASKITSGVDVRANGGYVIWWPSHSHDYTPAEIAPWPDTILDALKRPNKKSATCMAVPNLARFANKNWLTYNECMELIGFDSNDDEMINEIQMQLLAEARLGTAMIGGVCVVKRFSRESKYAIQAAAQTVSHVGNSKKGTRNNNLNIKSYVLGRIMARGWTPPKNLIRALWRGAIACGLVKDDGVFQTVNTIVSGLTAGLKDPYSDL